MSFFPPTFALTIRCGLVALMAVPLSLCAGCAGRNLKADNPVLGSAPPRRPLEVAAQTADVGTAHTGVVEAEVSQASFSDATDPNASLPQDISGVAATVNGKPILVSDVIEQFTPQLRAAEKQLGETKFNELKRHLIKRELPAHIEQAILIDSAMSKLKPDQKKQVDEQLAKIFSEELKRIQAQMEVQSLAELEAVLQQHGTSITSLQRSFNNRQLAGQAMGMLAPPEPTITRAELLKEYHARIDEFTEPEQVRWQQIWISYKKYGGKEQAVGTLEQVVQALKGGRPFEDVAREFSDGLKADDGGQWDWTRRGELTNEDIDRMLFELPVGEISQVVEGDNAYQIIRVTERKPQTTRPFSELQNQLGAEIKQRKQSVLLEEVLADLKKQAVVTTMFDGEPDDDKPTANR